MIISDALRTGIAALKTAEIPDAPRDARRLMAFALGIAPDRLTLVSGDDITDTQLQQFTAAIAKRGAAQPVAQIIGSRLFYGRQFTVTPDVLDPRPETEILIAAALERPFSNLLDLGTGTGAILLTLLAERNGTSGIGADVSDAALGVATANAKKLDLMDRAKFVSSDWFENITGKFDLIVSNPPYITAKEYAALDFGVREYEPKLALTPGGDGLDPYRIIAAQARRYLHHFGWLMVEIGPSQGRDVAQLFRDSGLVQIQIRPDFDGRDRVVLGQNPE